MGKVVFTFYFIELFLLLLEWFSDFALYSLTARYAFIMNMVTIEHDKINVEFLLNSRNEEN